MVDRSKIPIIPYGSSTVVSPITGSTNFPTSVFYFRGDQVWKVLDVPALADIKFTSLTNGDGLLYDSANRVWRNSVLVDKKVAVDSAATPDYLGSTSSDGVLRTNTSITYTDGGNYITLSVNTGAINHNVLSNLAVGDVHTQYLLAAGTRDLTGDWTITVNDIQLTAGQLRFRDSAIYIISDTDGHLDLHADDSVDIVSPALLLETAQSPINFVDTNTQIWESAADDLTFKDANAGTYTLTQLAGAGNDELVGIDAAAIPGYLGAAAGDGVLRTDVSITYTDGGDFVTLSVSEANVDHNSLNNLAVGDVHTQYLLAAGTRDLTGDWTITVNDIQLTAGQLRFRDSAIYIESTDDGHLDLMSDVSIDLNTAADTDLVLNFFGTTNSGVITWMEDEDYFNFGDSILMNGTEPLYFGDTGSYIYHDGTNLSLIDDASVDIVAPSLLMKTAQATINFADTNTQVWEDASSNLTFKDANAGTKTLTELSQSVFVPVWNLVY